MRTFRVEVYEPAKTDRFERSYIVETESEAEAKADALSQARALVGPGRRLRIGFIHDLGLSDGNRNAPPTTVVEVDGDA